MLSRVGVHAHEQEFCMRILDELTKPWSKKRPNALPLNKLPSPISMRNARRTLRVCPLYPPALMSLPEERAAQMSSQALRSFSTLRVIFHARLKMLIVDNAAAGH